jgi:hypothetical protein
MDVYVVRGDLAPDNRQHSRNYNQQPGTPRFPRFRGAQNEGARPRMARRLLENLFEHDYNTDAILLFLNPADAARRAETRYKHDVGKKRVMEVSLAGNCESSTVMPDTTL